MNEINKEERMQGLSGQQVSESKAKYGTNELAKKETESLWSMFIGAFDDIWIKVLCAALALKVILAVLGIFVPALSGGNDVVEIISIVIAIALATGFSTLSEYRNTSRSEKLLFACLPYSFQFQLIQSQELLRKLLRLLFQHLVI